MAQEYLGTDSGATLDQPKDAGPGVTGKVKYWNAQLALASKKEKNWREMARKTWERYRNDPMPGEGAYALKKAGKNRFNILYANVQTRAPALYNSVPIPDVRRRFRDHDETAKVAAQVLERCLTYTLDAYDFDHVMKMAILDEEIPGRAVSRVRYTPTMADQQDPEGNSYQEVVDEAVSCEPVQWDEFRMGPGRTWQTVTWVAFMHTPTLDEAIEKFGAKARKVPLDYENNEDNKQTGADESDPNVLKRMVVWEIWDKTTRKVYWLAPSWPDDFLKVEDDYLNLIGFFPVPRPLYAIETPVTTVPVERYRQYQEQAEELDKITRRIMALVGAMKVRGAYDGRIQELSRVLKGEDNDLIPITTDGLQEAMQDAGWGDLSKAIWLLPIEVIAMAIEKLYIYREQIIQIIYQLDGTADIMRGETDPNETLGAQAIKSNWGSLRLQDAQKEVARYARDLIRLQAEVISEKFSPERLSSMSSIKLPTAAEKQQAQQMLQMVQMQGQQPDPQMQQVLQSPTWEEVIQLLRSDMMRGFRVDIETDSTIQNDIARQQQNIGGFIQGFASFVQAVGPAIEAGFMTMETATTLFKSFAQTFQLGKQAEDAIDDMAENPPQPKSEPDPMQIAQMEMQAEQQKAQAQMGLEREKMQGQAQLEQQKMQSEMALQTQRVQADMALEQQRFAVDTQMKQEDAVIDRQIRQETAAQNAQLAKQKAMAAPRGEK